MDKLIAKFNKIIIRIGHGEIGALDELYKDYGGLFYSMAKKYLSDKSCADDVVSEVFCKIVKFSPKFNPKLNGLNWVFKIIKNTCIDWNRKLGCKLTAPEYKDLYSVLPSRGDIDERSDLKRALSMLTDEENTILYLKFWEGLTIREIANELKKPKSSVQYIYKQSIKKLAGYLDERD